jgi:putative spermidine/putrescine transport system permease protein
MSDIAIMEPHAPPRRGVSGWKALERRLFSPGILILPLLIFLLIFFFWPAVRLMSFSVMTQNSQGLIGSPFTLAHYVRFFEVDLYQKVLWATIRISLITSVLAAILAYPVATVLVRGNIVTTRIITLIVIAPLAVSVVVRAYGWQLILGNGPTGLLNYVLMNLGIIDSPMTLLFSDAAVIIGSLHIFFPMMVLPLSSALGKIDPNLQQAASVPADHLPAQPSRSGRGFHAGLLSGLGILRHSRFDRRSRLADARQHGRTAGSRGL